MGIRLSKDKKIFGKPLKQAVKTKNHTGPLVPEPLKLAITYIEEHALEFQGLYRVPGNKAKIMVLADEFDAGRTPNFATAGSANTSGLVKYFLARLPEPLTSYAAYDRFLEAAKMLDSDSSQGLTTIKEILDSLPKENYDTLGFVVRHLEAVAQHKGSNQMSDVNLALVFSPSLFKSTDDSPIKCLQDTPMMSKLLLTLIRNHSVLLN